MGMTRMGPLTFQQPVQCRDCDGEGEVIAQRDKCTQCGGNKISEETKTLDVVILPGCSNGKKIKFRGENDQLVRRGTSLRVEGKRRFSSSLELSRVMCCFSLNKRNIRCSNVSMTTIL